MLTEEKKETKEYFQLDYLKRFFPKKKYMLKNSCSNDPYSPYLQDFFEVISLKQSTMLNIWFALCKPYNRMIPSSSFPVTLWLSEGQGHPNWNHIVEFSCF